LQVEIDAPLVTAYAASNERGLQLLLVNRGTEDKAIAVEPKFEGSIEVKTLNDAIFDELLAYRVTEQAAAEAIMVPARSVILVRGAP
jgi:hypothetical protein